MPIDDTDPKFIVPAEVEKTASKQLKDFVYDRAVCHCGDYIKDHTQSDNHSPVPMLAEDEEQLLKIAECIETENGCLIQEKNNVPYWLLHSLAEYVMGHDCPVCNESGESCRNRGLCVTEYGLPCAATWWLGQQRHNADTEPSEKH